VTQGEDLKLKGCSAAEGSQKRREERFKDQRWREPTKDPQLPYSHAVRDLREAQMDVRPVYHNKDDRVRAHVFVAALALLLDRALEKKLRAAGSSLSSPAAWQALETVRCVQMQIGDRTKLCVTRGSRQAAEVWKILRLTELDPPEPVQSQKQSMW
jgi:hypothetical protein